MSLFLEQPQRLPRASEDLYEIFGLAGLAAEVAREKPNGEKNALRKTYKGHIKRLGVAGHFDVQKKKEDAPSEFMAMLQVPELEWNVHQAKGREVTDGLSESTLSNLGRAMTMSKGPIPRSVWDTSVLGDPATTNANPSKPMSAKLSTPNTPLSSTPNALSRPKSQLPPGHDPNRPRRNIKKRSYGDSSYEGYGEGFPDDDGGIDTGYSTGEGEGGHKRRKKVTHQHMQTLLLLLLLLRTLHLTMLQRIPGTPHRIISCNGKVMAPAWSARDRFLSRKPPPLPTSRRAQTTCLPV